MASTDESVQTTKHAKSVKNWRQILKYRHVCCYNTRKLNAAFCCTTVQDVGVLMGSGPIVCNKQQ